MMRQTIMIKSRTCSSTTCPPTLGRSPQTMAERKIPVQKGFCASFFYSQRFGGGDFYFHFHFREKVKVKVKVILTLSLLLFFLNLCQCLRRA